MKFRWILALQLLTVACSAAAGKQSGKLPPYIAGIRVDKLGGQTPAVAYRQINPHLTHVVITATLPDTLPLDDWQVNITPAFMPSFHWAPHLTPGNDNIIAQHVFRSPAIIVADRQRQLTIIPDLELLNTTRARDWYMDMDAQKNRITLGRSLAAVPEHVLFARKKGNRLPPGKFEFSFYVMAHNDAASLGNPFRRPVDFFWEHWGAKLFAKGEPVKGNMEPYVAHTYNWAFNTWERHVWQAFQLNGVNVGAPVFIVNVTQSPNYPGIVNEREFRSVWNQAWFSSLRSAAGLYRYARRTGNRALLEKANLTKELALSFPKKNSFFYGLIGTEMEQVDTAGKKYNRSKGWQHYYWGNSNRNPYTWDARQSPFHLLDMSWTALLMLQWHHELEADERLLRYAEDYAAALLRVQQPNGFFPGWLDLHTLQPMQHLNTSPETSLSVTFLLTLHRLTGKATYKTAALKAMNAVIKTIVPNGRWEDFETYWSCSRIGSQNWMDHKVPRNNMYKQNNFSMYWTAEALLESYRATQNQTFLQLGQRTLDELLMTQASWQPHFIPIRALGGFGVMNADGEWNDARQSLFAELIVRYGKELKKEEYVQRGLAALRASFVMMYCPENPGTRAQWEKAWPFFGKADYGFMMENYGHGGQTNAEGLGIGEFTIYDWGNGAAAEAYNRMRDHYGTKLLEDR